MSVEFHGSWLNEPTTNADDAASNQQNQLIVNTEQASTFTMAIKPPKTFVINSELDMSREWTEWLELYENYFVAAKISKEDANVQTANFLSAAGRDVLKVLNNLTITAEEKKVLDTVKEKTAERNV